MNNVEAFAARVSSGEIDLKRPPLSLYCIYDVKAQAFAPPFVMANNAIAIRTFGQECRNPNSNVSKFPDDFTLHHVGYFDEATAQFASVPTQEISRARNFVDVPNGTGE